MTLNRNPSDFFAESEQVAFCTQHLVTGIEGTDDPLLIGRHFSYQDTQLTRLGGPNFEALPINRPIAAVNSMQQDGYGQTAILAGRVRYSPHSLGGGCPVMSSFAEGGYEVVPRVVTGPKVRDRAAPAPDYFSQATMFWGSMTPAEQDHIVAAFSFELGKVEVAHVRARMLRNLAEVDATLTQRVAAALGVDPPPPTGSEPAEVAKVSPARSQVPRAPGRVDGRLVAILAGEGADGDGIAELGAALGLVGARALVVAPHLGLITSEQGSPIPAAKAFLTAQSVEFDAAVVAGGAGATPLASEPLAAMFAQEAFRHCKPVAAWGLGVDTLATFAVAVDAPGVVAAERVDADFCAALIEALGWHRFWERQPSLVAAG